MIHSRSSAWSPHQARLDQCKVTMGTLEKQLEEGKQRVQAAENQRGAATGKHQSARGIWFVCICGGRGSSAVARGYAVENLESTAYCVLSAR